MWGRFRGGAYRGHDTITVSPEFKAAQESDSAMPTYLVYLVLPDYAASAVGSTVTSSGDADSDHPKEGAINSDHTEINIGAAATADNGVGKSSWKSSASPNGTGNVWLEINFGQSRIFNRVKLYNLAADPLTSYLLQYWDGGAWVDFAGTVDKYTPPSGIGGYGTGGYGFGPYGGTGIGGWLIGPTGGLDVFDFAAITSTKIRLVVYATTSTGPAQLVELEVYRLVDITDRVRSIKGPDRTKDYKLSQPIATQEVLTVDNSDRFFSISYSPTAAEIAAGFINSDLALLGINLEVNEGFYTTVGKELIRTFTGSIDSITPTVGTAEAEIIARDGIKHLMDHQDSCKLKTAIDITDCIRYILNRNGVSNYEMTLATTNITEHYFFYYETAILTVMQELIQAAGDAMFFFDETGAAVLQYYLMATPQTHVFNTEVLWEMGTLTNVDSTSQADQLLHKWFTIDDFVDLQYTSNPTWTITYQSFSSVSAATGKMVLIVSGGATNQCIGIQTPFSKTIGTYQAELSYSYSGPGSDSEGGCFLPFQANSGDAATGYGLRFSPYNNHMKLERFVGNAEYFNTTTLADCGACDGAAHVWQIARTSAGVFTVYKDGVLVGTATDNTYTSFQEIGLANVGVNATTSTFTVDNIYFTNAISDGTLGTVGQSIWISPSIDRNGITFSGILQCVYDSTGGSSVDLYVSSSSDGITWSSWIPATNGAQDPSGLDRYEKVKIVLNCPIDNGLNNANTATPIIYGLTANWYTGTGQSKFSNSVNFNLTDQNGICDLQEQIADNLAGDSAIINDVAVTAAPLVLTGADTDDQWQAITGTPPDKVSVANPLIVSAGTVTYNCVVSGGMDTSNMAGGSCIAITWGSATGSAAITYIHPTKPILTLTVTSPGTITDLRLIGKSFSNLQTPYQSLASDAASIARHRKRHADVNNNYFRDSSVTDFVAAKIVSNQKDPVSYIPSFEIFPPRVNLQPGDRVNVVNEINGIATDYYVVGYSRTVEISESDASASMNLTLMKIPKV